MREVKELSRFPVVTQPGQNRLTDSVHFPRERGVFSLAEHSASHREGNFFMQWYDASQEGAPLRDKAGARYGSFLSAMVQESILVRTVSQLMC